MDVELATNTNTNTNISIPIPILYGNLYPRNGWGKPNTWLAGQPAGRPRRIPPPPTAGRPTIYLDPAHHICGPPVFPAFAPYRIVFGEVPKRPISMAQRHSGFRPPRTMLAGVVIRCIHSASRQACCARHKPRQPAHSLPRPGPPSLKGEIVK